MYEVTYYKKRINSMSECNVHTLWNSTILWWEQSQHGHTAFTGKSKSYGRHLYSITVVQKVLVLHTKAFFFHKNNFLGEGGEWVHEIFQKPICFEFSKNIILKHTALKCFHVEIMMEGTEYSFTSPLWNFQKSIDFVVFKFKLSCKLLLPRTLSFQ